MTLLLCGRAIVCMLLESVNIFLHILAYMSLILILAFTCKKCNTSDRGVYCNTHREGWIGMVSGVEFIKFVFHTWVEKIQSDMSAKCKKLFKFLHQ